MQTLTQSDLNFVLSRCPRDILKLLKANPGKLFLAGGFIRATIAGEKVSDIDLFGQSIEDLERIAKDLTLERKGRYFKTDNAYTVLSPPRMPVQFITRWLFPDPDLCILSFDFTVCQAVIWTEKIDIEIADEPGIKKTKIIFHSRISDDFYRDLAARRLVYTFPKRDEEAGGSFLRVIKFIKRGYNIQAPSLAGVIARIVSKLDFDRIGVNIPGHMNESRAATVITGLLRQVDPLTVIDGVDFVDEHEVIQ